MQTSEHPENKRRPIRWAVPLVGVAAGIGYLVTGALGGQVGFGIFGLLLMLGLSIGFVLIRGRSETVQGLLDRRDERINAMDLQATAFAGGAVILAVIVAFMVELARGHDGHPYAWLGAVGGVAYVAALVYLRVRR